MSNKKENVLVFDVWGDYAHYRRFYTTTSPLTFPIPPKTALSGLIGAIVGLEKENNRYLEHFALSNAKIGLRLMNPIKKTSIAENLIHTKKAKGIGMNLITRRDPTRFEFLKEPKYRIYFHSDGELYSILKNNLMEHKSVYTPCLGLSELIANFKFIGEFEAESIPPTDDFIRISSILPMENINDNQINYSFGKKYFSVRVPIAMNTDRVVTAYSNILFETSGKAIEAKLNGHYWKIINDDGEESFVYIWES